MNSPRKLAPMGATVAEAIQRAPALYPDNGFTFQDMKGVSTFWSFGDIERETARRARALQDVGLGKGDRVGLVLIEPQDFVLTFLAATRVGVVPVPLYPPLSMGELDSYVDRLSGILETAGASWIVASERLQSVLWQVVDKVESVRSLTVVEKLTSKNAPDYPTITPDDLCFLQYTSGSTSVPKGVMVTHAALVANVKGISEHFKLDPHHDTALAWLPLYHDMGLIGFVLSTMVWGFNSVLIPTLRFLKRPNTWLETIHETRATITFCPPFALPLAVRRAREEDLERWDLSSLHTVGVGAEPIHPEGCRAFTELFSTRCGLSENAVGPAYGMAEATLAISLKERGTPLRTRFVDADVFTETGRVVEPSGDDPNVAEHVSCGIWFPAHEVRVVHPETGEVLGELQEGELCVAGPSVTPGYFQNEEATAGSFRDGWLHTGDLGYVADGEVYVTGRMKDLIILNGRNIHPQSIEWVVNELEGVRKGNVVAFSVPGDDTELVIVAIEVRPEADRDALPGAVREAVTSALGIPVEEVVLLDANLLPKTSSGKLQRRKTRQYYLSGVLGQTGSRQKGGSADKVTLARHVARSAWARLKNNLKR